MTRVLAKHYSSGIYMEMVEGFERWKDKTGHREFLLAVLSQAQEEGRMPIRASILDAAVGVGHDAIYLAKHSSCSVYGNDIEDEAIHRARENAREAKVSLNISQINWLGLCAHKGYHAILCVGNSLTYLFDRQARVDALANFAGELASDGTLIIDERNYQYMFDHAREIKEVKFEYPGVYALSKNDVHLTPVSIRQGEVRMRAKSSKTGNTLDLKFYPFKRNEMLGLLRETGFRRIEQFSDYVPGFNPNADFYQYVCTK